VLMLESPVVQPHHHHHHHHHHPCCYCQNARDFLARISWHRSFPLGHGYSFVQAP
jgi:hypothetical protein